MENISSSIVGVVNNFIITLISLVFHKNRLILYKKIVIKHIMKTMLVDQKPGYRLWDDEISKKTKIPITDVRLILRALSKDGKITYSTTNKNPKQLTGRLDLFSGFDSYLWITKFEIELVRQQIVNYLKDKNGRRDTIRNLCNLVGDRFLTYAAIGDLLDSGLGRYSQILGRQPVDFEFVLI